MNNATKKPGLQALAFSTAIQRILHFFTFSHAQFPPGTRCQPWRANARAGSPR